MAIDFKGSVRSDGIKPEASHIIIIAHRVFVRFLDEDLMTVTSITDGKHSPNSLHYEGLAVDIRTRDLSTEQKSTLVAKLRKALGNDYDVVLESTHLHVEFDPI